MNKRHAGASALMALALLAGCSDVNQLLGNEESVDYKSTRRGDPLSIPPDLTQANNDPRYKAPASGTATYSQFQQQGLQQQASAGQNTNVLPERADMRVERDGDLRWLVIERPPEQLFSKVVDFWTDTGFTVSVNNPQAGIIETDWAENRAKIPESWLRQVLGSVLETAWDSGEREKFRTRVERVNGHTEIYITHNQMLEKRVGSDGGQVQWTHGKEDPGLNAAMLARLMVYLGTDVDAARKLVAQAEAARRRPRCRACAPKARCWWSTSRSIAPGGAWAWPWIRAASRSTIATAAPASTSCATWIPTRARRTSSRASSAACSPATRRPRRRSTASA